MHFVFSSHWAFRRANGATATKPLYAGGQCDAAIAGAPAKSQFCGAATNKREEHDRSHEEPRATCLRRFRYIRVEKEFRPCTKKAQEKFFCRASTTISVNANEW